MTTSLKPVTASGLQGINSMPRKARPPKPVFTTTIHGSYDVSIAQTEAGRFTVTYGKQVHADLDYSAAGLDLGLSIMHALVCAGKLEGLF